MQHFLSQETLAYQIKDQILRVHTTLTDTIHPFSVDKASEGCSLLSESSQQELCLLLSRGRAALQRDTGAQQPSGDVWAWFIFPFSPLQLPAYSSTKFKVPRFPPEDSPSSTA